MADYQPIDCNRYDILEASAVQGKAITLQYLVNGNYTKSTERIKTIHNEGGQETLETISGLLIRLDQLLFVDQEYIHNPFARKNAALKALLPQLDFRFPFDCSTADFTPLDLSRSNERLMQEEIYDTPAVKSFVFEEIERLGAIGGYGGYGEVRAWYQRNATTFGNGELARTVHLGVDFWLPAKTPVLAIYPGTIHSFANNEGEANYGPTVVLEHQVEGLRFYSIYGHLSKDDLTNWSIGTRIKAGEVVGHLGHSSENGNWPPHVHLQLMGDMMGWKGDFPGVSTASERHFYLDLCPDPAELFFPSGEFF